MGAQRLGRISAAILTIGLLVGTFMRVTLAMGAAGNLAPDFAGVGFRVDSFFAEQRTGLARMGGGAEVAAVDSAGRLVAITGGPRKGDVTVARYLPNGQLDPSFGAGGAAVVQLFAATENPNDPDDHNPYLTGAYIQADGALVIAGGKEGRFGVGKSFLARIDLTPAALDTSFGAGGIVGVPGETVAEGLTEDSGGRPVVVGYSQPGDVAFIARFTTAGAPDPSFGEGGLEHTFLPGVKGSAGGFETVITVGDEIIAASGLTEAAGGFAARYQPDGQLDPGFGREGVARFLRNAPLFARTDALQQLPDGRLLVLGDLGGPLFLTRLDRDGRVDRSFGSEGTVTATPKAASDRNSEGFSPGGLAVEGSGRIVVAGTANGRNGGCYRPMSRPPQPGCFPGTSDHLAVVRYLPSGAADCSFGHRGVAHYKFAEGLERIGVANSFIDPPGRLVLAGSEEAEAGQGFLAAGIELGPAPSRRLPTRAGPVEVTGAGWADRSLAKLRRDQLRLLLRISDPLTRRCSPADLAAKLVTPTEKPTVIARARDLVGAAGKGSLRFVLTEEAAALLRGRKGIRLRLVVTLRHSGGERRPVLRRKVLLR